MNIITINKIEYILFEEFLDKSPIYCKDIRNGRELIRKKKISDFIYAKLIDNKWIITNGTSYNIIKKIFC
jgi:hypothetical protein